MRRALLMVAAVLAALPAFAQTPRTAAPPERIEVRAKLISQFEARDPQRRQFGSLEFRGGIQLTSSLRHFGGLSAIRVEPDGQRFLAATDKGYWLRGRITYDGTAPTGIADAEMAPILGADGRPLAARGWYDTEALAEDSGTIYVAIERVHQIVRLDYGKDGLLARGRPIAIAPEMRTLPANQGIEALVWVPKGMLLAGTLLAFSEKGLDEAGNIRAFLIGGRSPGLFTVKRSDDFEITDAAITPNGTLLILERRFSLLRGPAMRIRQLPLAAITPGAVVDGEILIEADAGFQIDNMEGLSVHRASTGELVLTLVSDDNFSSIQRTLLLQFTLTEP